MSEPAKASLRYMVMLLLAFLLSHNVGKCDWSMAAFDAVLILWSIAAEVTDGIAAAIREKK